MANQSHLDVLKQGAQEWNEWRTEHPKVSHPDLSGADLEGASLNYARLRRANLRGANLRKADLQNSDVFEVDLRQAHLEEANLRQAKMRKAHLEGAHLSKARFLRANLSKAHLQDADLREANFRQANLSDARLDGANLYGADLYETDLSGKRLSGADLRGANLSGTNLYRADLSGANLSGADLTRSSLVLTNLENATLEGCRIYGISAWSLNLKGTKQQNLNVSEYSEPAIRVDDLEVAQFVYLLLNYKKLRNVLNAITERGVLILGRFGGGGLEVLEAIAAKLRESEYQPFIFDFDRPADRNYTETIKTLVGLSRFVIVDLSGPSVPQELYATVPHFKIPFVPIIEEGRRQYSMFGDLLEYGWVLDPPVRFVDVEHLLRAMPTQIIAPAEKWVKDRQDRLADLFDV